MSDPSAPWHAHVYFDAGSKTAAEHLHQALNEMLATGALAGLVLVGKMHDKAVGPHPKPEFEIQFLASALPEVLPILKGTGLTCLVHPVTDDDLADHTSLAMWLGEPLPLDLSVLDPPGHNKGLARFGKTHFGEPASA